MCTAISDICHHHLFGRTLDLELSYRESVIITPRVFPLRFRHLDTLREHHAMIGTALLSAGAPLYYDAINEKGLAIAALNFPVSAVYHPHRRDRENAASFEIIPLILAKCDSVSDAVKLLTNVNITPDSFSDALPASPLHWLIADKSSAVTVESVSDGLKIYENPFGVMTNEPPFPYHTANIANYMPLCPSVPENRIFPAANISPYSRGMGAIGLPGDFSSTSRFVRAVFATAHTLCEGEDNCISRFFHVMDTVSQPCGCALAQDGRPVRTVYTSCADTDRGVYYFTTYGCRRIRAVTLSHADLDSSALTVIPMDSEESIKHLN